MTLAFHPPTEPVRPVPPVAPGSVAPWLIADWRHFIFLNFSLPAAELAALVPHPLDTYNGRAFVSLVFFTMERMRPGRFLPPALGRALLRPISDHAFVNVRTYVRGDAGPGIHFLTEWVNNPLSLRLGPLAYGLPYHHAEILRVDHRGGGLTQILVEERRRCGATLGVAVQTTPDCPPKRCRNGSLDQFLLERYTAYTHYRRIDRFFQIEHEPWQAARVDQVRFETRLVEETFPWFRRAEFASAHLSPGFADVRMSGPRRLAPAYAAEAALDTTTETV